MNKKEFWWNVRMLVACIFVFILVATGLYNWATTPQVYKKTVSHQVVKVEFHNEVTLTGKAAEDWVKNPGQRYDIVWVAEDYSIAQ